MGESRVGKGEGSPSPETKCSGCKDLRVLYGEARTDLLDLTYEFEQIEKHVYKALIALGELAKKIFSNFHGDKYREDVLEVMRHITNIYEHVYFGKKHGERYLSELEDKFVRMLGEKNE